MNGMHPVDRDAQLALRKKKSITSHAGPETSGGAIFPVAQGQTEDNMCPCPANM